MRYAVDPADGGTLGLSTGALYPEPSLPVLPDKCVQYCPGCSVHDQALLDLAHAVVGHGAPVVVVTGTVVAVVVVAGTRLAIGGLAAHQIRIVARTSTADWCDVTVNAQRSGQPRQAVCAQRLVKSCAGVVRLASTWKAGLVSVAKAKQLSFFHADDYEVSPPSYTDGLLAILRIRRPVCRCGDPYKSHQHYRKGDDCSFCRCERYGPVLFKPSPRGERSVRLLRQLRLS